MIDVVLWALITVSVGGNNSGTVVVVDRFGSYINCEHARNDLPKGNFDAKCVRTVVARPK